MGARGNPRLHLCLLKARWLKGRRMNPPRISPFTFPAGMRKLTAPEQPRQPGDASNSRISNVTKVRSRRRRCCGGGRLSRKPGLWPWRFSVGLTDQTLSCTARAPLPKPTRHDTRLHVRRAMRVACRRDDFDDPRQLGCRAEAGPCQLLRRVGQR